MKQIRKVLVTGANGAVASDLVPTLISYGYKVLATDIDCPIDNPFKLVYLDIRDIQQIEKTFKEFKPDCVVHLAAETDVEYSELNPEHAKETNGLATRNIALACKKYNATLVYTSSIGVFDGKKKGPYTEEDTPHPLNVYGKTKYEGEEYVIKNLTNYFILRAGWMIGGFSKDKKFVMKIMKLIKKGATTLDVVDDKSGTPTYTPDLSHLIAQIIKTNKYGIYHVVSRGNPTRYEVAKRMLSIIKNPNIKLNKVKSKEVEKVYFAPRPDNETADSTKIDKLIPGVIRNWEDALDDYLSNSFGFEIPKPKFSIIICLYIASPRFFEDLKKFNRLKYDNIELIIVTDKKIDLPTIKIPTQVVLTGKERTGVGEKRDFALKVAKGDFIAYIDDDAYPDPDWLSNALLDFAHPKVGAVGGPNITPSEDSFWAQVGGLIYESYLTSGGVQNRFVPKEKKTVSELQGVNLIIRASTLKKIGGFATNLFSGDDTKVCYSIRLLGFEVLYDPQVRVFHHRREFPGKHLKQIRTMASHRGMFVKKYTETSLHPIYFLPSLFFLGSVTLLIASFLTIYALGLLVAIYLTLLIAGYLSVIKRSDPLKAMLASFGIILTHLTYGYYFLKGLLFL